MGKKKDKPLKITKEDLRKLERRIRREEWIEKGCPFFKPGAQKDKKKEKSRKRCREKIRWED